MHSSPFHPPYVTWLSPWDGRRLPVSRNLEENSHGCSVFLRRRPSPCASASRALGTALGQAEDYVDVLLFTVVTIFLCRSVTAYSCRLLASLDLGV